MGSDLWVRAIYSTACFGLLACDVPQRPVPPLDVVAPPTMRCDFSTSVWPSRNTEPPSWGTGRTLTYAVSAMTVDPTPFDERTPLAGFDLDGRFSRDEFGQGCDRLDAPSDLDCEANCSQVALDPQGRCTRLGCVGAGCLGGVDNQLPGLLDMLGSVRGADFPGGRPGTAIERAYRAGQAAIVVQLSGVDSLEQDELVAVRLFPAVPVYGSPDGGGCSARRIDQRYAIARRAVIEGDPARPAGRDGVGRIVRGQLRARFEGPISIPFIDVGPSIRDWSIEIAQIAVNLSEEAGSQGNLGGAISVQTLLPSFGTQPPPSGVAIILSGLVDLPGVDGRCFSRNDCTQPTGRISVGVRFSLVRAVLEPRALDAPPAGACPTAPLVPIPGSDYERFDAGSLCEPGDAAR